MLEYVLSWIEKSGIQGLDIHALVVIAAVLRDTRGLAHMSLISPVLCLPFYPL